LYAVFRLTPEAHHGDRVSRRQSTIGHGPPPWAGQETSLIHRERHGESAAVLRAEMHTFYRSLHIQHSVEHSPGIQFRFGEAVRGSLTTSPGTPEDGVMRSPREPNREVTLRTDWSHSRLSRFPARSPACLPTSAPAIATTHNNPTTSPSGAGSSAPAPGDSVLL